MGRSSAFLIGDNPDAFDRPEKEKAAAEAAAFSA
jgi:hypothetical protein